MTVRDYETFEILIRNKQKNGRKLNGLHCIFNTGANSKIDHLPEKSG
jgi:hypothetical protein